MLETTGAPVYRLANLDDLAGIMETIRGVGAAVGEEAAAERVVAEMERRLAAVASRRAGRPRPRVLSYSGGFTAGRGTSFDDIVRRAGGINEAAARGIDKFPRHQRGAGARPGTPTCWSPATCPEKRRRCGDG